MQPGDVYILAIVLTALFVAPFNGLARVIVLSWIAGHVAWTLGAKEELVNMIQHGAAAVLSIRYTRRSANLLAWTLFAPMLAIDLVRLSAENTTGVPWWLILSIALIQAGFLPFGMDENPIPRWREWARSLTKWPLWRERRIAGI